MSLRQMMASFLFGLALLPSLQSHEASAQSSEGLFVLVVELEIDPAQLEKFKAAVKENGETAVRVRPGRVRLLSISCRF